MEKQRDYMPIDLGVKGKERVIHVDLCVFAIFAVLCVFALCIQVIAMKTSEIHNAKTQRTAKDAK